MALFNFIIKDNRETNKLLHTIIQKLNDMAKSQADFAKDLRDLKEQNDKSRTEILQKIADLEAAVQNAGNVTPEVEEAFAALKASVQTDDDIVPDQPE